MFVLHYKTYSVSFSHKTFFDFFSKYAAYSRTNKTISTNMLNVPELIKQSLCRFWNDAVNLITYKAVATRGDIYSRNEAGEAM